MEKRLEAACVIIIYFVVAAALKLVAEQIPVRHPEGVTFGFLVLRTLDGQAIAYGEMKQVVRKGQVMDDLQFRFKDGSYYREITKFTQDEKFRLLSDQVEQRGPSFKEDTESWIDATTGKVTVKSRKKGKEKTTTKHLDIPADVSNGLLFTLVKNLDPAAAETTVSMVNASTSPRVVKLNIFPGEEKTIKVGILTFKTQQYVLKVKIEGIAGVVAPLIGKQPPDIHLWIVKSEAPTFIEFEGPMSQDSPIWRIELAAPEPDARNAQLETK